MLAGAALHGQPPPGYYDTAQGKIGADLRSALHMIVHNHHPLAYSGSPYPNTADALGVLDEDPANTNNVICIYSGYSIPKTNIGSASGAWNREHLWPQSYGIGGSPARTDLHHMRPEQANVNSSRGNNYYESTNPGLAGYKAFTNAASGLVWSRTADTWEPPDSVKGDVARALLYLTVRYTGDPPTEPNLTLTDNATEIASGTNFMGRYTTLLRWHFADPVNAVELARNDGVSALQGNRNPFVDHPEWVAAAFIPHLTGARSGTNMTVCWTNDYAPSLTFEQSPTLGGAWMPIASRPILTATNTWMLRLPIDRESGFFRARLE
jgi:endonuclease I